MVLLVSHDKNEREREKEKQKKEGDKNLFSSLLFQLPMKKVFDLRKSEIMWDVTTE